MEWIPGPTLAERVNQGRLSINDSLICVQSILSTLDTMHSLPLIHRDLKPDNIILRGGAVVDPVIIDLGLAWAEARADESFETEYGQEMGNRFLRLPENSPGRVHRDQRSDATLAAGLLLYMLVGRAPRMLRDELGRAPHEALSGYVAGELTADHRWPRLSRVFGVAFQNELELRYPSVRELALALDSLEAEQEQVDLLTPALERLHASFESTQWRLKHDRQEKISKLCSSFDSHLRELLRPTKLSLPGGHGFDQSGLVYSNSIGLQIPNISGGTVCSLNHQVQIGDSELSARFRLDGKPSEQYYSGPLADIDGLQEAMWQNAKTMVVAAIDDFRERTGH